MTRTDWVDLAQAEPQRQAVRADVCVVGAGAAGIYLAVALARLGVNVVLLEAGPSRCVSAEIAGFEASFEASPYLGATEGRFFGMGGTTGRWGGQLVPHTDHDLRCGTDSAATWKCILESVSTHAAGVLQNLGYRKDPEFSNYAQQVLGSTADALRASGLAAQAGLVMPFRLKNLVRLLSTTGEKRSLRVFYNAVVKSWTPSSEAGGNTRIIYALAESGNQRQLEVSATDFVLAAGAIESTRILLEIDSTTVRRVLRPSSVVGRHLGDHVSVSIADVAPESLEVAARLFAPRFSGAWMRSFRFLEAAPPKLAPRAFAHFVFGNQSEGFKLVKEVLGAFQARRMPRIPATIAIAGLSDVGRIAYQRLVKSSLHVPKGTPVHLRLDLEQVPDRENCIRLADEVDALGRRLASIRWQVSDRDHALIRETSERILSNWQGERAGLPRLLPVRTEGGGSKPHDAYHPVGTCRMGEDENAVVDHDLRVHGLKNLWVCSTAVLPSAGTANPTFTMLCLTHGLAQRLHAHH